jgi:serine/threonine-protein kinase RsbW
MSATPLDFALQIPVEPAYFGAARLFAASIARHFGCEEASIEDLKVAVSEACNNVLFDRRSRPSSDAIQVKAWTDDSGVTFEIRDGGVELETNSEGGHEHPTTEQMGRFLGVELIRSLFPDAEVEPNEGAGMDIRFTLSL